MYKELIYIHPDVNLQFTMSPVFKQTLDTLNVFGNLKTSLKYELNNLVKSFNPGSKIIRHKMTLSGEHLV